MPICLKGVLQRYGLSQTDWANAITQANGQKLSHSAATSIINWSEWPRKTPQFSIQKQTEDWLTEKGVLPEDIKGIWTIDADDRFRMQQPAGVHIGQGTARANPQDHETEIREMLHPATKSHFGLRRDPFQNDVLSSDDVYLPLNYREIREAMLWAARNSSLTALIGESGAGKSVLMRDVIEDLKVEGDRKVQVIQPQLIDKTRLTSAMITEAIIYDLMPDARLKRSAEGKERQAKELLKASDATGKRHVLVIEEAHDLNIHMIKLLKRYWEIVDGHRHLLGIILVAQPELQTKLDAYRYEARELINRLEIAHLEPLGKDLEGYLEKKFGRVGKGLADLLAPDACDALRLKLLRELSNRQKVSMLYPLRVNVEVTRAMNKAADLGMPMVTADVIRSL